MKLLTKSWNVFFDSYQDGNYLDEAEEYTITLCILN